MYTKTFVYTPPPAQIVAQIQKLAARCSGPYTVAVDGGSGAGKSTLARILAKQLQAALIPMDDFYAADIPDHRWDSFTIEERFRKSFDWNRLREQAIKPLQIGLPARWITFDFVSGLREDGTYGMESEPKMLQPADVILIEGAFSASPPLADLVDYTILVDVPLQVRNARTAAREDPVFLERWHQLWDPVENYYHHQLRPQTYYDLVVSG
jgi:uridine kinase